jgi:hypothetical protein
MGNLSAIHQQNLNGGTRHAPLGKPSSRTMFVHHDRSSIVSGKGIKAIDMRAAMAARPATIASRIGLATSDLG